MFLKQHQTLIIPLIVFSLIIIGYVFGFQRFIFRIVFYNDPQYSPVACDKIGGEWIRVSTQTGFYEKCEEDGKKQCHQDSQCQHQCIYNNKSDAKGFLMGKCVTYSAWICAPYIPTKTKDVDNLLSGSCI